METLAQSVSTIAPTSTPAATIPLVAALAGNGTWLAYFLATIAILLVAWCVSRFAKYSASPGSLYTYASMILPPWMGAVAAWSLLLAYVATASSVIGGFYNFANLLAVHFAGREFSTVALALLVTGASIWTAWRDVKISARLMLWIEAVSLLVILAVVVPVLIRHGMHWDPDQIHLSGMTGSGLRLGLVLAMFSFVGFESATTLGAEARNPLKTIPRAVLQSAVIAGGFFIISSYAEVVGFHMAGQDLGTSLAPMHVLAGVAGAPVLGLLIDFGAAVSLFAGTLGCITAAARVLLLMSHHGLAHGGFRETHAVNDTPTRALAGYRDCGGSSGRHSGPPRFQRAGCLWLDGFAGDVRIHRHLRAGLRGPAPVPEEPRRLSAGGADYSLAGVFGNARGAGRESVSRARRAIRKNALHLFGLSGARECFGFWCRDARKTDLNLKLR